MVLAEQATSHNPQATRNTSRNKRQITGNTLLTTAFPCRLSPVTCRLKNGFTFVELIIASVMLAILFVGLASHLRGGVMVWHRTTEIAEALQQQRVALNRLDTELVNAVIYDMRSDAYDSTDDKKLPSLIFESSKLRWITVVSGTSPQFSTVRVVSYRSDTHNDQRGLWRTSQSLAQARVHSEEPVPELVLPGCDALSMQYAYLSPSDPEALEWHDSWSEPPYKAVPRLISYSLRLTSGRVLQHIMTIPIGTLAKWDPSSSSASSTP